MAEPRFRQAVLGVALNQGPVRPVWRNQDRCGSLDTPEVSYPGCGTAVSGASRSLLSLDDVLALIRTHVHPVTEWETLPLSASAGRILVEPVFAAVNVPAEPRSAMDGYALSGADLKLMGSEGLPVVGKAFAGRPFVGAVPEKTCVRIMTGAVMPAGTDTVIRQEEVQPLADGRVRCRTQDNPGANVRLPGEDLTAGTEVLPGGRRLRAADIGLLASLGQARVTVRRPVRVGFFTTGDELRSLGEALEPGQVYDSNRHLLHTLLAEDGCEVIDLGNLPDDPHRIRDGLSHLAERVDLILTTAGVSVGEADFVKEAVGSLGEVSLWGVALKMGRPLVFGKIGRSAFLGLAGNPVAAMINYLEIVRPSLRHLSGEVAVHAPRFQLELGETLSVHPDREAVLRGRLQIDDDGVQRVYPLARQGAAVLLSMSQADCLIRVPRGSDSLRRGARIWVEALHPG